MLYGSESAQKKWADILNHPDLPAIKSAHRKAVTALMLENITNDVEYRATQSQMLAEAAPANAAGAFPNATYLKGYDPVLMPLIRRMMPNLMAFDVCGVQPMKASSGLIFAMKAKYTSQDGTEALHNEANTAFSGTGTHSSPLDVFAPPTTGTGLTTANGEALGTGGGSDNFAEMAFSIDKVTATAKTRGLAAEYTLEIAQDLKAIHGIDAETELSNILSAEVMAEINREVIRTIYRAAVAGAQQNVANAGTFDLDVDSNGRWSVEKYKGLMVQIERDANAIARETRRGKGNIIICDSDTASALSVAGLLDCGSALKDNLTVDDTGNTFVGVLNNRFKVYIDPYAPLSQNFYVVGFKGASAYDAGLFYCPYVPLTMVRATNPGSFVPRIGFKTRYAIVTNPFGNLAGNSDGSISAGANVYYRKVRVTNLL